MSEPSQPGFFASRTVPSVRASPRQPPRRRRAPRARRGSAPPSLAWPQPPSIRGEDPANGSRISPSEAESQRMPAFGDHVSRAPRRHAPFSDVHPPFALLQGEGGAPARHFACWFACPYLQTALLPLRLQTVEQQSALVVQDEPDGRHTRVVVVVLVVTVVVDGVCVV